MHKKDIKRSDSIYPKKKRDQGGQWMRRKEEKKRRKQGKKSILLNRTSGITWEKDFEGKKTDTIESKREKKEKNFVEENKGIYEEIREKELKRIKRSGLYAKDFFLYQKKNRQKNTYFFAKEWPGLFPIFQSWLKDSLIIIHLPSGPSFYFTISSITPTSCIYRHGRATSHIPELIINNFTTYLGLTVENMFRSLFPTQADFEGRQVVTIHNQRDFIFIRRHRYIFKNDIKVSLQELGPRFTLKLRRLQRGIHDRHADNVVYEYKPGEESNRTRFWLS
uniref:Coiled-coil protein n=1 Tax=Pneumocystis carinii TaxID=4754 RepID=Q9HEW9_PNECA|nr:coiled-coil protein [Pneumocystis carinii]